MNRRMRWSRRESEGSAEKCMDDESEWTEASGEEKKDDE